MNGASVRTTIDEMVESRARSQPGAAAVTGASGTLSYAELDARAAAVAAVLRARGVTPGCCVGVRLGRDAGLVVALLGILKAGAAYVPVEPSYPDERVRYVCTDASVAAVVTGDGFGIASEVASIRIDSLGRCSDAAEPAAVARRAARATDPAYVIYTSGSTGRPKGVVVEHRSVAALVAATRDELGLGKSDVWTCFHSAAFDFSVWEMWGCLATGGRLIVVPDDVARVPEAFRALLHAERVTVLNQTPSAFAGLLALEAADTSRLAVRLLIFGGEPLGSRMLLRWFDRYPEDRCRVVNMYGITETTVHCTWKHVTRADALLGSRSVGVPLRGWTVHVLDARERPVPAGVPGEIWIGGVGLARGYLERPGLTARSFRPDHVTGESGQRLYRSGDRGRRRRDGEIEVLGRLDRQVKIRGHRIELDELKNRLLEDESVHAAAVVVNRRGVPGDAHLDAFVAGRDVEVAPLRARLQDVLPNYMLPSTITVLESLPLTENGKLDVARLPTPAAGAGRSAASAAERSPHERGVAPLESSIIGVWQEVLGVRPRLDDNFFMIGGNSISALRTVARLREQNIAQLSARTLYRNPTVRALAAALIEENQ